MGDFSAPTTESNSITPMNPFTSFKISPGGNSLQMLTSGDVRVSFFSFLKAVLLCFLFWFISPHFHRVIPAEYFMLTTRFVRSPPSPSLPGSYAGSMCLLWSVDPDGKWRVSCLGCRVLRKSHVADLTATSLQEDGPNCTGNTDLNGWDMCVVGSITA